MQLIDSGAEEAKYLSKTQSIEYWDEQPSPEKIQSVTEYLRDVRHYTGPGRPCEPLTHCV